MEKPPLVSLSELKSGNRRDYVKLCDTIGWAAREIGFLRIRDHGIDPNVIENTYGVAQQFFSMPEEFKRQYYIALSSNHRGYVPFSEKGDYPDEINRSYEAFDLGVDLADNDPDYLSGNRMLGPNVWPDLPGFKEVVSKYYNKISALGRDLCSCLEVHLGLPPGAITHQMSKPISQLRLLHYVRQHDIVDHRSVNMGAHTDYECLTLLHTRNEGLQVMNKDDSWIDVPVDPSVFVVNIGDMLEAWSNGLLRSTPHRVLNLSPERFSIPYFVAANHDTEIKPFAQLVNPNEPPKYEPFLAGAHLERMLVRDFPYLKYAKERIAPLNHTYETTQSITNPFENRFNRSTL